MTDAKDPLLGAVIAGRYLIERRLGMGGMGAVYLAAQQSLGRGVALKVLRGELVSDPVAVERFKNEAKVIAQLGHPHVVGIHDFGTTDAGMLFIAMEYLPGFTLAETVRKDGPMTWRRTIPIVRDVARALSAAHRRGIVHRDLKPENILLIQAEGLSDFVKVLDFGIAKLTRGHEVQGNLTGTGLVPGTPGYIAPEQITGAADDPRSDLYALGVTWFEMLSGRRPFEAESAMKIFLAQLEGNAPRITKSHPTVELPAAVDDLLMALLARDPDGRPGSADDLLARLRAMPDCHSFMHAGHVETPVAGSFSLEAVNALHPDEPTLPAVTTPSMPVPRASLPKTTGSAGTPSTGSVPTPGFITVEQQQAIARRWARRWAAAGAVVVVLLVLAVFAGWQSGRLGGMFAGRVPLPIASTDENVRLELTNALEAFYEGELDAANRGVDKVLRAASDEPGALVLKIALSSRMEDPFAQAVAHAQLEKVFAAGLPESCSRQAGLVGAVLQSSKATRGGVRSAWQDCPSCQESGLGNLLFAGFFAERFSYDAESGLRAADAAIAALPRAALPVADKARFVLRSGDDDAALNALPVIERGLQINPGSPLLHQVKAEALLALGRYADAAKELRVALSMSVSPEADALLAQTLLLLDDEEGRSGVIEAAVRRSTPAGYAALAIHHGDALVGAGRVQEAVDLYQGAIAAGLESGTPADLTAASRVALEALRAADTAGVAKKLIPVKVAAEGLLKHINLPSEQADVMKWVLHLVDGAFAADAGERETAKQSLAQLSAASSKLMPQQAHKNIVAYLSYRVHLAAKENLDEAEAAAEHFVHPCTVLEARARIAAAREDVALERERWQLLLEREGVCRLHSYGGMHSLNARASLVTLDAKAGKTEDARQGMAALRASYPRADADLPSVKLALAALGGDVVDEAAPLTAP